MERSDKFLCDCGVGTRSQVKQILKAGRVAVDGKPAKDGAQKIGECIYGKSITDPCIGWQTTERMVLDMADQI